MVSDHVTPYFVQFRACINASSPGSSTTAAAASLDLCFFSFFDFFVTLPSFLAFSSPSLSPWQLGVEVAKSKSWIDGERDQ